MKKYNIIISMFLFIFFSGCSQNQEVDIIVDKASLQTYDYEELEALEKSIEIAECEIPIPQNGQVDAFCIYHNIVYYSVGFSDYLANNTGSQFIAFEDKYNTQIRSFNMQSKKDCLLYQYKEDHCMNVTDIACNGTCLIWEDYQLDKWRIQKLLLEEMKEPEIILDHDSYESGLLWTITPTITKDGLYWYDQSDDSSNPITLFRYDFNTQKTEVFQNNLDLTSPYTHVNITNGICTFFEKKDNSTSVIYIYDLKKRIQTVLTVPMSVSNPISNGEICVWVKGEDYYDRNMLYIYDLTSRCFEQIAASNIFSYGILDEYIIMNQTNHHLYHNTLLCYDTKNKTYFPVTASENTSYGFILNGFSNHIYMEKWSENKENCLAIINLSSGK